MDFSVQAAIQIDKEGIYSDFFVHILLENCSMTPPVRLLVGLTDTVCHNFLTV